MANIPAGYGALLNLARQPHCTAFVTDVPLPPALKRLLLQHLKPLPTTVVFIRSDPDLDRVLRSLRQHRVNLARHYVSIHGIVTRDETAAVVHSLAGIIPRSDLASVEMVTANTNLLRHLLGIVMRADYSQQDRISSRFFALLGAREPYEVRIENRDATLTVLDRRAWFQLAGKLRQGEFRILPGGEVSYTGDRIEGDFVVDGTILGIPQHATVRAAAQRISRLGKLVRERRMTIEIRRGRLIRLRGNGRAVREMYRLLEKDDRYRNVTEVGISFNKACDRFVDRWADPSNEARPGVHIGLGGDPSPDEVQNDAGSPLVHIDCIAANSAVIVNGRPFLRTSS